MARRADAAEAQLKALENKELKKKKGNHLAGEEEEKEREFGFLTLNKRIKKTAAELAILNREYPAIHY